MTITHGDLFAGIGGFSVAAERAGMQTIWQVEIDPIARAVLARHWPDVPRADDVQFVSGDALAPVDVITAGFPCQDLSVAGKRVGLEGARSGLFWEITRIVTEMREATNGRYPGILLLENVPGFLSSHGGRDFGVALDGLADCGALDIGWRILDARHFRVAQRRRRLFLVCDFTHRRASQVLALADSLSGHPAPRREAGQEPAAGPPGGAGDGGVPAVAHSLRAQSQHSHREDSDTIVAFDWQASVGNDESWRGKGRQHIVRAGDYAGAVSATRVDAVGYQATGDAFWREGVGPLAASDDNGSNHVLAFSSKDSGGDVGTTSPTLRAMNYDQSHLNGGGQVAIAFTERTRAEGARLEHQADLAYALTNPGDGGRSDERMIAFQQNQRNEVRLLGGDGQQAGALPAQPGMKQQNYVANTMTVRRLTPTECSRLQAYPDGWIPDTIADSHHYRLLGNAVCVAVVEWLMRRVVAAMAE